MEQPQGGACGCCDGHSLAGQLGSARPLCASKRLSVLTWSCLEEVLRRRSGERERKRTMLGGREGKQAVQQQEQGRWAWSGGRERKGRVRVRALELEFPVNIKKCRRSKEGGQCSEVVLKPRVCTALLPALLASATSYAGVGLGRSLEPYDSPLCPTPRWQCPIHHATCNNDFSEGSLLLISLGFPFFWLLCALFWLYELWLGH